MDDRRAFLGIAGAAGVTFIVLGKPAESPARGRFAVSKSAVEWRRTLGPERYHVLREAGTERPFTSPLLKEHRRGTFVCAGCANKLFSSVAKFESGTGWPSFWRPIPAAVITRRDKSLMMDRTEALCARCGGHLGHVFNDGPKPTGLRYCMNGLALRFLPAA